MGERRRVAVAMSGGVDSSFSCLLLKKGLVKIGEDPIEVIGVSFLLFDGQERSIERAKKVAQYLEIEHYLLDLREIFKEKIISYFLKSYEEGLTPNPCALCNRLIKFGLVHEGIERDFGATFYATGHYVEKRDYKGYPLLKVSANKHKDQSYFLTLVKAEILPKLLFPVGGFSSKEEVRKKAKDFGLNFYEVEESQDVCFLMGKPLRDYLKEYLGEREGELLYKGRVIGRHRGCYFYTIGQRRGLNLPLGKPVYVIKIEAKENRIYLGTKEELKRDYLYVEELNFHLPLEKWEKPMAQIRYKSEKVPVKGIERWGSFWKITFEKEVVGVAPGQVCAFYEGEILLGGGIILKET